MGLGRSYLVTPPPPLHPSPHHPPTPRVGYTCRTLQQAGEQEKRKRVAYWICNLAKRSLVVHGCRMAALLRTTKTLVYSPRGPDLKCSVSLGVRMSRVTGRGGRDGRGISGLFKPLQQKKKKEKNKEEKKKKSDWNKYPHQSSGAHKLKSNVFSILPLWEGFITVADEGLDDEGTYMKLERDRKYVDNIPGVWQVQEEDVVPCEAMKAVAPSEEASACQAGSLTAAMKLHVSRQLPEQERQTKHKFKPRTRAVPSRPVPPSEGALSAQKKKQKKERRDPFGGALLSLSSETAQRVRVP